MSLLAFAGCDRDGFSLVPQPSENFPGVIEIGELNLYDGTYPITPAECNLADDNGNYDCFYGNLGAAAQGTVGGATATFTGSGGFVCVMVDPESVFWNQAVATQNRDDKYAYGDNTADDGDIDLSVGISAYYSGSPGLEIGDFSQVYTDSMGNSIEIQFDMCVQTNMNGWDDVHAGRGTVEACQINTAGFEGVNFTVVAETWSIPLDDGVLGFGIVVADGQCRGDKAPTECVITGESLEPTDGEIVTREGFGDLETAFCDGTQGCFCCDHPEMCGDEPFEDAYYCLNNCSGLDDTASR